MDDILLHDSVKQFMKNHSCQLISAASIKEKNIRIPTKHEAKNALMYNGILLDLYIIDGKECYKLYRNISSYNNYYQFNGWSWSVDINNNVSKIISIRQDSVFLVMNISEKEFYKWKLKI